MVRLVPCGARECKQAAIDRQERERETSQTRKGRKEAHRTEYVLRRVSGEGLTV
jgi:hypothetical protein